MSVQRAHGHERMRATAGSETAREPITLEAFKRGATARMDALARAKREREATPRLVTLDEAEAIIGQRLEPA